MNTLLLALSGQAIAAIVVSIFALMSMAFLLAFFLPLFSAWTRLASSGRSAPLASLLGMRLRRTPIRMVTDAFIELAHRESNVTLVDVERGYLANRSRIRNVRDLVDFVELKAALPKATTAG